MNARLRMYKYCYSNEGAIYAKGLCFVCWRDVVEPKYPFQDQTSLMSRYISVTFKINFKTLNHLVQH